jgi:hypothetical protein
VNIASFVKHVEEGQKLPRRMMQALTDKVKARLLEDYFPGRKLRLYKNTG